MQSCQHCFNILLPREEIYNIFFYSPFFLIIPRAVFVAFGVVVLYVFRMIQAKTIAKVCECACNVRCGKIAKDSLQLNLKEKKNCFEMRFRFVSFFFLFFC